MKPKTKLKVNSKANYYKKKPDGIKYNHPTMDWIMTYVTHQSSYIFDPFLYVFIFEMMGDWCFPYQWYLLGQCYFILVDTLRCR